MTKWKKALPTALMAAYWVFALLYWESLLHWVVFEGFVNGLTVGFTIAAALLPAFCVSLLKKGRMVVNVLLTLGMTVLYGSQLVYNFIFGTLYSVALIAQGGEAMASFWRETLSTMRDQILWLLALLVPLLVLILLWRFCSQTKKKAHFAWVLVILAALSFGVARYAVVQDGTEMFSNGYYYTSGEIATNQVAQRFGLLTTFRLELTRKQVEKEESYYIPQQTEPEAESVDEEPVEWKYNVLNLDWDALNAQATDKTQLAINEYCSMLTGTRQNEYTGMLKDYNLIVVCAESFSTAAIHPELTPTLYRMSQEGFLFKNYYNTFPNTTTDGEYALMQGLYPDTGRSKAVSSLYASRGSYLPFTLGNAFAEQRGFESRGYHNYRGSYYGRDESHPNMGYTMKFAEDGMKFTEIWPASDLEMMEQSVDDYIGQEQFHVYYMTFSGHYKYEHKTNAMVRQNWDLVKDLPYSSNAIRGYLACNIEFDRAMEYLMQRLEDAGVADRTAIVIAGDHFPYGLTNRQYSELIGYEIDNFSKYKSSLIFWVGGLEENVVVDEYCCNVDVLPTLLNLWGLEYDSRLLAGTDVFSDGTHVAVLIDKSFLTDKVWFNANTGEVRYLVPESELPEGYIESMNRLIATRFSISTDILNSAYYNLVFSKGEVKVNRRGWNPQGGNPQ